MKTITGRQINVSVNRSRRTFTIKTESATYRTYPMSKEEFNSAIYNTVNDWQNFLNHESYYKVR